jgi:prepilin-type N-terminal cleavage/methylation domain-containing protein/prepilin-type processing-associated H-X9-DG protein
MRKARAFTLVELLIVVGIIAVLIAVLLPALNAARKQANQTKCLNNMREVGLCLQMYVGENKTWLPPLSPNDAQAPGAAAAPSAAEGTTDFGQQAVYAYYPNFLGSLVPYTRGNIAVFKCPTIEYPQGFFPSDPYYLPDAASDTTYLGNAAVMGRKISMIKKSAEIAYLQEQPYRWGAAIYRPMRSPTIPGLYSYFHDNVNGGINGSQYQYSNNHNNGGNLVFVDGHAEYRKRSDIHARDFGLTGGTGANGLESDTSAQRADRNYNAMYPIKHYAPPAGGGPPVELPLPMPAVF